MESMHPRLECGFLNNPVIALNNPDFVHHAREMCSQVRKWIATGVSSFAKNWLYICREARRYVLSASGITVDVKSARLKKMPAAHPQFFTTIRF